jgi:hypothetical protein
MDDDEDFTPEEEEILQSFRNMPDDEKDAMLRMMQYLAGLEDGSGLDEEGMAKLFEQFKRRH